MSLNTFNINNSIIAEKFIVDKSKSSNSNYYGFTPLKTGSAIPYFTHDIGNTTDNLLNDHSIISFHEHFYNKALSSDKPVVIIFRPIFNTDSKNQIAYLEELQTNIEIMGGKLLTITNLSQREILSIKSNSQLSIISDSENKIAETFGLYRFQNNISDYLSGIEGDISLPAFYVINKERQITFHYIDYNFRTYQPVILDSQRLLRQLLTSVYKSGSMTHYENKAV